MRLGRKEKAQAVTFISAADFFEPQVAVRALQDISGWVHRGRRQRWSMSAGRIYYVDVDTAVEFISKGYVEGVLPRHPSPDEVAEWQSQMNKVGVGNG